MPREPGLALRLDRATLDADGFNYVVSGFSRLFCGLFALQAPPGRLASGSRTMMFMLGLTLRQLNHHDIFRPAGDTEPPLESDGSDGSLGGLD